MSGEREGNYELGIMKDVRDQTSNLEFGIFSSSFILHNSSFDMSDVILEAKGIQKSFGGVMAVAGVSLTIRRKEIFALIGPNGAGKTTMFNLISGAYPLDQGEVFFDGKPIHGKPSYHIAAMGLIRTFQNLQIFGTMTVLENVMVGSHLRGKTGFLSAGFRLPGVAAEEKRVRDHAMEMLKLVGMESRANEIGRAHV